MVMLLIDFEKAFILLYGTNYLILDLSIFIIYVSNSTIVISEYF